MKLLITRKVVALVAMVGLLAPSIIFAQSATTSTQVTTTGTIAPAAFCANIDVIANQVYKVMFAVQATYSTARNQVASDYLYKTMDAMVTKGTADAAAQAFNNKVYVTLSAKAKTQAQKDALTAFKTVYDQASATLKSETSLALTTYKTAMNKIMVGRSSSFNDSFAAYQTAINTAIAKAKTDCKSGVDSTTAYNNFKTSLKTSNATVATKAKMGDLKAVVQPLNQTLTTSLKSATTAYKNAVKPAWTALAASLGVPATVTTPEVTPAQ
ncbi:MAG: hypothetical protein WCW14_03835 [Candidatus Paceibacterota bacterium]|jgi:hypothetical protein